MCQAVHNTVINIENENQEARKRAMTNSIIWTMFSLRLANKQQAEKKKRMKKMREAMNSASPRTRTIAMMMIMAKKQIKTMKTRSGEIIFTMCFKGRMMVS